jgi:hypothetical protein
MTGPGMLPSLAIWKPARSAQVLTSRVLACYREPVISGRGFRARAMRMASATSSAARRLRFMASSANTARESSPARISRESCRPPTSRPADQGGEHRLGNGLLLRSDVHTLFDLFDRGYLGVDLSRRLVVSPRLRADFSNGEDPPGA